MLLKERWEARPPDGVDPELWRIVTTDPVEALCATEEELYFKSFRHFARRAWEALEGRAPIWEWYHDVICDHLQAVFEGRIKRLLINIPPRMSKSTLVSVLWPAWCWLHRPGWRMFAASAVDDVVKRDAVRFHELVDSEWYQQTFQPEWGWSTAQDAKGFMTNTARGQRISKTVGQRLQGVDADVEVVDDPLDDRDAHVSAKNLTEHIEWFRDRAIERLTHPDCPVVIIMQRLHEADLAGWALEQGDWDVLILPAIMEGQRIGVDGKASELELAELLKLAANDDRERLPDNVIPLQRSRTALGFVDPRRPGEILSSRLPLSYLRDRAKKPRKFAAKFQQRPSPAEGTYFHKDHFKYWTKDTLPTAFDFKVMSCDTTFREGRSNDWVVIQVWGVRGANVYLLDQIRKRMNFDKACEAIREMQSRHPGCRATIIEKSGNGPAIVAAFKASIPGIVEVSVQGDTKESRASVTLPRWAAGQVYLPHPHDTPWVELLFKPELLGFPHGKHDDQVDAMTLALVWIGEHPSVMPLVYRL